MLPVANKITADFANALLQYVSGQSRRGAMEMTTQIMLNEGKRWRISRADGSVSESELREVSHEVEIPMKDVPNTDFESVLRIANEIAEGFKKSASEDLFKTLDHELPDSQKVDGPVRPFDHEHFFEALEKMAIDFDETGEPVGLGMMVHPSVMPRLKQLDEEFKNSPELQARHDAIIKKKYEEFREREAGRRLVG